MPYKPFDLTGKVALVTGGNGGIGLGMALALAEAGADVAIWGTNESKNAAAKAALEKTGRRVLALRCDVSDEAQVEARFAETLAAMGGRVDGCFANAGVSGGRSGPFVERTAAEWDRVLNVNLRGAFFTFRAAARHMIARGGGAIVNVTSITRRLWTATPSVAYIASKAGLDGLTRALAMELIGHGIRVNAVAPGRVRTAMTDASGSEITKLTEQAVPLKRLAEPEEIARAPCSSSPARRRATSSARPWTSAVGAACCRRRRG